MTGPSAKTLERIVIGVLFVVIASHIPEYYEVCYTDNKTKQDTCPSFQVLLVFIWHISKAFHDWGVALTALFTLFIALYTRGMILDNREKASKELRAYVGFEHAEQGHFQGREILLPRIKNYGKTPAKGVSVWVRFAETPFRSELPSGFHYAYGDPQVVGLMLQTDQAFSFLANPAPDHILLFTQARANERFAYIYGKIEYEDIFGKPWRTKFCFRYDPNRSTPYYLIAHSEHNDEENGQPQQQRGGNPELTGYP